MTMLTIGDKLPAFHLDAVLADKSFGKVSDQDAPGRWKVLFFWPMDFTFICPTEIAAFGRRNSDFQDRDAELYGLSTDTHFVHLAWRKQHPPEPALPDARRHQA
jgi:lipoyl-dependent peroxiredoxin subunit C